MKVSSGRNPSCDDLLIGFISLSSDFRVGGCYGIRRVLSPRELFFR